MKLHQILLSLFVLACLFVAGGGLLGCVTAEDTADASKAHADFETEQASVAADLQAGRITQEEAFARMQKAMNTLEARLEEIGKRIDERTSGLFANPEQLVGLTLMQILGMLGLNARRNATRAKDPRVSNAFATGAPSSGATT